MHKEAFEQGFIKAAVYEGLTPLQAATLLKQANWLGNYLAMKAVRGQAMADHPYKSIPATLLNAVPYGIGTPFGESAAALGVAGNKKDREKEYTRSAEDAHKRGMGEHMRHTANNWAKNIGTIGAVGGAGLGGVLAAGSPNSTPGGIALGSLLGAGAGGGLGLTAGYLGGGIGGGVNKAIIDAVNPEAVDHAAKMKARHPFLTALPFGDVIGANMKAE